MKELMKLHVSIVIVIKYESRHYLRCNISNIEDPLDELLHISYIYVERYRECQIEMVRHSVIGNSDTEHGLKLYCQHSSSMHMKY